MTDALQRTTVGGPADNGRKFCRLLNPRRDRAIVTTQFRCLR